MLTQISWGDYFGAVVGITALYYFVVILGFYRKDIYSLWERKKSGIRTTTSVAPTGLQPVTGKEAGNYIGSHQLDEVHELMEALKTVFQNATTAPYDKVTLLQALQEQLQYYPQLKASSFNASLLTHIAAECMHGG